MLSSDTKEVAVARYHHDVQCRLGHLDTQRDGERSSVDTMDTVWLVSFQKVDQVSRAAYTGHDHVIFHWLAGFLFTTDHGKFHCPSYSEIAATGAPFEIVFGVLFTHTFTASFRRALVISVVFSTHLRALNGHAV